VKQVVTSKPVEKEPIEEMRRLITNSSLSHSKGNVGGGIQHSNEEEELDTLVKHIEQEHRQYANTEYKEKQSAFLDALTQPY
jgi:hypothetical protein